MKLRHLVGATLIAAMALPALAADAGRPTPAKSPADEGVSTTPLRQPFKSDTPAWGPIHLFNNPNFEGTTMLFQTPVPDSKKMFMIDAAGVLHVMGPPVRANGSLEGTAEGYLRTNKAYADYKLTLEFRFPTEWGDSGLFIHMVNEDRVWMKAWEINLTSPTAGVGGNIGDLESYLDARMDNARYGGRGSVPTLCCTNQRVGGVPRVNPQLKPQGEWNTMEVVADGDTVVVKVNGGETTRMTGAKPSAGAIGLQAENGPVDLRNIVIQALPVAVACVHAAGGKDTCERDASRP